MVVIIDTTSIGVIGGVVKMGAGEVIRSETTVSLGSFTFRPV